MNTMSEEDCAAALQLCSWQHLDLDPQTALELEQEKLYHKRRLVQRPLPPPPPTNNYIDDDLPLQLHGLVGECSPPWKKLLKSSDVKISQTRLLLKQSYVKQDLYPLLSTREIRKIKEDDEFMVNVYDWRGNIYEMKFKLWGEKAHVLTGPNWMKFVRDYNLVEEEDWITIWMFRHVQTHQVCFVIKTRLS